MSEKKYPLATILLLAFLLMAANVLFYTVWGIVAYVIRDCVMFQITFFPCLQNPLIYLSGVFIIAIPLVPSFIVFKRYRSKKLALLLFFLLVLFDIFWGSKFLSYGLGPLLLVT